MTQLTISQRDAKIAGGLTVRSRSQSTSDDRVRCTVLVISGITLDDQELNALLGDEEAHMSLFRSRDGSSLKDPVCPQLDPLSLDEEIQESQVTLYVSVDRQPIDLGLSILKNIKLARRPGGTTEMTLSIESTPTLDGRIAQLLDQLDTLVQIAISYAHNPQQASMDLGSEAVRAANAEPPKRRARKVSERPGESVN